MAEPTTDSEGPQARVPRVTLRILVLDEGFMSGALAAIGLRDAGCDVDVLAAVTGSAATGGRPAIPGIAPQPGAEACGTSRLRWRFGPAAEAPDFDATVADLVQARGIDVIYPATEPLHGRCSATPASWRGLVFQCVGVGQRGLLSDKAALSAAAASCGVAIPNQVVLGGPADLDRAIQDLGLPLVVKGVRGRGGSTTAICHDVRVAEAMVARNTARGISSLVQQHVDGPTLLVGGVFDAGRPLRLYAGVKLMQHPSCTGPAVEIRSVEDADAIEAALAVFSMLRFTGLGSADLIRGAGGVRFLELNPRPWGALAAARDAGVDCFTPLASLLRGDSPSADLRFAAGITSRVFPLYLLARHYRRHPLRAARAIASDLRSSQGEAWQPPRQGWHLLQRLRAVQRRWPR